MRKYVRNNISKNDNIYSLAWWLAEGWKYKFSYPNDKSVGKVLSNVVGFILFFGGFGISYVLYCNDLKWFSAFISSTLFVIMAHMIPIMSSYRWSFIF